MTVMLRFDDRRRLESASVPGYGQMKVGQCACIVPGGRRYRVGELFVGENGRLMARMYDWGQPHSVAIQYPADRLLPADATLEWTTIVSYALWALAILAALGAALISFGVV